MGAAVRSQVSCWDIGFQQRFKCRPIPGWAEIHSAILTNRAADIAGLLGGGVRSVGWACGSRGLFRVSDVPLLAVSRS